jgi:hypothetical protein
MSSLSISSSTAAATPTGSGAKPTNLTAEQARYEKELSACVNCASATTATGKAKIQELSAKLREIKKDLQSQQTSTSSRVESNRPSTSDVVVRTSGTSAADRASVYDARALFLGSGQQYDAGALVDTFA